MKVLVIGSGGREHALCRAIAKSPLCKKLYCAPGNAGTADVAECLPIAADKIEAIVTECKKRQIDFVVIGPELPLTLGLADALRAEGIACFGPGKEAAQLEGSKSFMKEVCLKANIPTAEYKKFSKSQDAKAYASNMIESKGAVVIKADGLAAGKGVTIANAVGTSVTAITSMMEQKIFGDAGNTVVIEEFLEGEEVSFFAICDGATALPFAAAQDHKAVGEDDKGPNTGGMGAYSPAPVMDAAMQARVMREIIDPAIRTMKDMGCPFTGVLFAGLMMTKTGPKLLEFNVRFGDPETEAMLPRLKSDLLSLLYAASKGMLDGVTIELHERAALCVVMAANGYPGDYKKGTVIRGLEDAARVGDAIVFHAGTAFGAAGEIVANGGRVLCVTGMGATIAEAQSRAYQAVDRIDWPEGFCRRDIGWRAIKQTRPEAQRKIS